MPASYSCLMATTEVPTSSPAAVKRWAGQDRRRRMAGKKKPPKIIKGKVEKMGPLAAFLQKKPPVKGGRPY